MKPPAAVVLARRSDGLVLGVTRPDGGFALPGGVIEEGEAPHEAAFRELQEETGYDALTLVPLFANFYRRRAIYVFEASMLLGRLRSSDEGTAAWVPRDRIQAGPYGDFACAIFRHTPLSLPPRRRPSSSLHLHPHALTRAGR